MRYAVTFSEGTTFAHCFLLSAFHDCLTRPVDTSSRSRGGPPSLCLYEMLILLESSVT